MPFNLIWRDIRDIKARWGIEVDSGVEGADLLIVASGLSLRWRRTRNLPVDQPRIGPVQFQAKKSPFHERVENVLAQFALDSAESLYLASRESQAWHFQILGANAF